VVADALSQLAQVVVFGLVNGGVIAIGAVGLTLSYGVTRFINFAYGEFLTYGAYVALFVAGLGGGVPMPVAAAVAMVLVGILGVVVARVFFAPLRDRGPIPLLITSVGVAFVLRNLLRAGVGVEARSLPVPLVRPLSFAGVNLSPVALVVFAVALLTMVAIHLLLSRTMLGRMMRATSGNRDLARIAGVDTDRVVRWTWFVAAAVGGLAGVLLAVQFPPFRPITGWEFLLVVFAATILGGIGKPYGAMAGALVVGVAMQFGTFYLESAYTLGYAFAILVAALLVRPEGIAGGEI
jgi:branched-subunit amino acid ABC-type transport system permease component